MAACASQIHAAKHIDSAFPAAFLPNVPLKVTRLDTFWNLRGGILGIFVPPKLFRCWSGLRDNFVVRHKKIIPKIPRKWAKGILTRRFGVWAASRIFEIFYVALEAAPALVGRQGFEP
ncbi:MAG: hypothetical protein LBF26_00465 [Puniceicoccales bacterium]|nr:hypothetical protein [Puniceicoccales bacterium]